VKVGLGNILEVGLGGKGLKTNCQEVRKNYQKGERKYEKL
jgi:hypothetical protein